MTRMITDVLKRIGGPILDIVGCPLCELACKADCRGPFALAYRAGCWCYGNADDFRCNDGLPGEAWQ